MSEDKILKDKKTNENIYALDLEFDNEEKVQKIELEESKADDEIDEVFFKGYKYGKSHNELFIELPKSQFQDCSKI